VCKTARNGAVRKRWAGWDWQIRWLKKNLAKLPCKGEEGMIGKGWSVRDDLQGMVGIWMDATGGLHDSMICPCSIA